MDEMKFIWEVEAAGEGKLSPTLRLERVRVGVDEECWEKPQVLSKTCPGLLWDLTLQRFC